MFVLKTSSTRLQDMSWRSLQHVFSVTILHLSRRLEDVLKTSWKTKSCYAEDVLKTSWRLLVRRIEDVLVDEKLLRWRRLVDLSWRHHKDLSWRCLEDMSWRCLEEIFWRPLEDTMERNKILTGDLTNLNKYLTNLDFTNLYLAFLRRIQNSLITTQFYLSSYFETQEASLF